MNMSSMGYGVGGAPLMDAHKPARPIIRGWLIALSLVLVSGCWNSDNARHIQLGNVSVGQQMIDLKRALDENAITAEEYAQLKDALMSLQSVCKEQAPDDDG